MTPKDFGVVFITFLLEGRLTKQKPSKHSMYAKCCIRWGGFREAYMSFVECMQYGHLCRTPSMLEDLRDRSSCSSWDDPKAPLAKGGTGKALDLERSAVQDVLRPEGWDLAQSCQMCHEPEPPAESEVTSITSVLNCESGHGQMLRFLYIMLYAYLCLISFCGRAHLEKH